MQRAHVAKQKLKGEIMTGDARLSCEKVFSVPEFHLMPELWNGARGWGVGEDGSFLGPLWVGETLHPNSHHDLYPRFASHTFTPLGRRVSCWLWTQESLQPWLAVLKLCLWFGGTSGFWFADLLMCLAGIKGAERGGRATSTFHVTQLCPDFSSPDLEDFFPRVRIPVLWKSARFSSRRVEEAICLISVSCLVQHAHFSQENLVF